MDYPNSASVTIVTAALGPTRNFYERHFGATTIFDCGWYVQLGLGGGVELCLMEPQNGAQPYTAGLCINLRFDDADAVHRRIVAQGLQPVMPLEDHPWGDRGFGVTDPAGALVYCYHPIPPAPNFAQYFTERPT